MVPRKEGWVLVRRAENKDMHRDWGGILDDVVTGRRPAQTEEARIKLRR